MHFPQVCFSPDGHMILAHSVANTRSEFEVRDIRTRTTKGEFSADFFALWASFSSDGRYVVYAGSGGEDEHRFEIFEVDTEETVLRSNKPRQQMALQDAKDIIRNCGPMAHKLWQFPFERHKLNMCSAQCSCCSLDVDNILNFVPLDEDFLSRRAQYCKDIFVIKSDNHLQIFKLERDSPPSVRGSVSRGAIRQRPTVVRGS